MSSESNSNDDVPPPAQTTSRRRLALATALGACALAAVAAGPSITLALAPLQTRKVGGRWVRTVKLDQLEEGKPRRVAVIDDRKDAWTIERGVELGSVWLIRRGEKIVAFSTICPHLGCSVNVTETAPHEGKTDQGFACPCHTSAFDPSGKRVSGPSPRDLDTLETKVEDGHVWVDFRRFRIGVAEKIET